MELIDQCQKTLYEKCKYKVKIWEHNFKKTNGRLPSKLDIKEAEIEVRNAYKTYFQLKTAALEHSFRDVDGFNSDEESVHSEINIRDYKNPLDSETNGHITHSTWGLHLNKTLVKEEKNCDISKPASNLNLKITKKLSVGSKLIKRNPRKSLSQVKSESSSSFTNLTSANFNSSMSSFSELIEPTSNCVIDPLSINLEVESSHCFNFKKRKDVPINQFTSYSSNIIQNVLSNNERKLTFQNIDLDWLARVENSTNIVELENEKPEINFVSDEDIIDNSDDDNCDDPIMKKMKHNDGSISCFKIGESQKGNEALDFFTGDSNKRKINHVEQNHCTFPNDQVHDIHSKKSIPQNDTQNTVENTQNIISEAVSSESNNEIKIFSIPQIVNSNKKLKGKNLSQNFVRINLKKKIYARGKKTQKFAKYKKKWKNKQKFSPETEEDMLIKGKDTQDKLLPLDAAEDILVTLNQASGNDISSQISPKKYLEGEDESDDDMTLIQLKKLIDQKSQRTKIDTSNNEKIESKSRKTKQSPHVKVVSVQKKSKQKLEKKILDTSTSTIAKKPNMKVHSIAHRSRVKRVTNNLIPNKTTPKHFKAELDEKENLFDLDDDSDLLFETLRLEQTLNQETVCPIYATKNDGSLIATPQEIYETLRLFGHETFREGQEKAVMRILSGKSTLVTLSTGSGKSLCYQLPAYLFGRRYKCITLVISPLISLMEDQIKCIPGILNAACLHGNQSKNQRDIVLKRVSSGEVNILMISPESIMSYDNSSGFGSLLTQLPPIAFACLDEAHCLSQWSHNFRPSYLVVCKILQESLGVKVILGLTATATKTTRNSLMSQLGITDGENGIIKDTPVPPNLSLSISKDPNKDQALLELLLSKPFKDFKSIIIYCLRRDECEKVATFLRTSLKDNFPYTNSTTTKKMSLQAEPYHAGLSAFRRKTIQQAFVSGKLRIIVATIAFGMGINKPDIRCVIHYNMPAKFESYVQEIGRAGRDNQLAQCHVFLGKENADIFELSRHIYSNSVDRHIIRKLLRNVFPCCNCKEMCTKHEVMFSIDSTVQELDVTKEIIATLLCYLELHENQYIKILKPSYAKCKILSYGGRDLINKVALSCEALRIALKLLENDDAASNSIVFPILPVAKAMNHNAGICKGILKNLEWINVSGQSKRSSLTVEFFDISFHLLSPGNLPDTALDEVLDSLYNKVLEQENASYSQLIHFNTTLAKYSSATFTNSLINNENKSESLKRDIRDYFESEKPLNLVNIPEISEEDKCVLLSDIRSIINKYHDTNFTGRSIAKIFHGISSPNIPAYIWGRTAFWRRYLRIHFNIICKLAAQELIKMQL